MLPLEAIQRRAWMTASISIGGWYLIGSCTVLVDGGRTLLNSETPPWLVFGDWDISVDYGILRLAIFLSCLISESALSAGHSRQCLPKYSGIHHVQFCIIMSGSCKWLVVCFPLWFHVPPLGLFEIHIWLHLKRTWNEIKLLSCTFCWCRNNSEWPNYHFVRLSFFLTAGHIIWVVRRQDVVFCVCIFVFKLFCCCIFI